MKRAIKWAVKFKRDFKRELKALGKEIDILLFDVLAFLISDTPLPTKYQDHKQSGEWEGCRECHIKPDLLLIYERPDNKTLRLMRLGSHSELFKP